MVTGLKWDAFSFEILHGAAGGLRAWRITEATCGVQNDHSGRHLCALTKPRDFP